MPVPKDSPSDITRTCLQARLGGIFETIAAHRDQAGRSEAGRRLAILATQAELLHGAVVGFGYGDLERFPNPT